MSINDKSWKTVTINLEGARVCTVSPDKVEGCQRGEKQSNLYCSRIWRNTLEAEEEGTATYILELKLTYSVSSAKLFTMRSKFARERRSFPCDRRIVDS